jgi:Tol biopolymer transport system component
MDASGSGIRRITFEGSYNTSPTWSPDGKWIAYTGMKGGKNQIFMVKSDGTELRQLTLNGNNESPSFSPDGLFLALTLTETESAVFILCVSMEKNRGGLHQKTQRPWRRDGRRILNKKTQFLKEDCHEKILIVLLMIFAVGCAKIYVTPPLKSAVQKRQ